MNANFKLLLNKSWLLVCSEGACVVMDNFSSHKVAGIQEAIEAVGAHLVYLSPYPHSYLRQHY
ncbi:hypothetical protein WA1_10285 [Scytonema hofmannii PCC 7110]|uniref:Tc1-like transposase DDE domain-containing protein n=1 Tax=Scytonema hofmannii PCC 7110 TaxID=128403 RepID=A0A139WRP0_9CYAN|nr:transposase [Scytonema hofmannii]KYC35104.1 hypothetical protein WA1_10285 [Scytonema hofmannii PCC 7110]